MFIDENVVGSVLRKFSRVIMLRISSKLFLSTCWSRRFSPRKQYRIFTYNEGKLVHDVSRKDRQHIVILIAISALCRLPDNSNENNAALEHHRI